MIQFVYVFAFLVPIIMLFVGIENGDTKLIKSGLSLLCYIYTAFAINVFTGFIRNNEKPSQKQIYLLAGLFILSIILLILGAKYGFFLVSACASLAFGIVGIYAVIKR